MEEVSGDIQRMSKLSSAFRVVLPFFLIGLLFSGAVYGTDYLIKTFIIEQEARQYIVIYHPSITLSPEVVGERKNETITNIFSIKTWDESLDFSIEIDATLELENGTIFRVTSTTNNLTDAYDILRCNITIVAVPKPEVISSINLLNTTEGANQDEFSFLTEEDHFEYFSINVDWKLRSDVDWGEEHNIGLMTFTVSITKLE